MRAHDFTEASELRLRCGMVGQHRNFLPEEARRKCDARRMPIQEISLGTELAAKHLKSCGTVASKNVPKARGRDAVQVGTCGNKLSSSRKCLADAENTTVEALKRCVFAIRVDGSKDSMSQMSQLQ